jgi:hypothetical protein
VKETRPRIFAKFARGGAPDWVVKHALATLNFTGIPQNVTPEQRLWVWDSVAAQKAGGWSNQERQDIENFMLQQLSDGNTNDYCVAEKTAVVAPWPAYDKLQAVGDITEEEIADQILARVQDMEISPDAVLDYERENMSREAVVAAIEKYRDELKAQTEIIVSA